MPIVAESPPLVFGATPAPPAITPTPRPVYTPVPAEFVRRHEQFIDRIDGLPACFKRGELGEFTDTEFIDHIAVAMKDRYITQEKDIYCSMKGVQMLSRALKRLGEE